MSFIRPGKVTCAGAVVIFMVLPNSIWKGPDAKVTLPPTPRIEVVKTRPGTDAPRVRFRNLPR